MTSLARAIWFPREGEASVQEEVVPPPGPGEVTVQALGSLVSRGTEMLAYRGELDSDVDLGLPTITGSSSFPLKYGYQVVGEISAVGEGSGFDLGDVVFAKHPHQSRFTTPTGDGIVRKIPDGVGVADALFINLTEVALASLHDVPVRVGDTVVVFGLGIVGCIIARLAQSAVGVGRVVAVDPLQARRRAACEMGLREVMSPEDLQSEVPEGADVVFEVTGNPAALQDAISVCGMEGTIAVVSFFGERKGGFPLNSLFHFRRQRIVSCQVSRVGSGLQPRWSRDRRFDTAARLSSSLQIGEMLSHEAELTHAPLAYRMLNDQPNDVIALAFYYGDRLSTASVLVS